MQRECSLTSYIVGTTNGTSVLSVILSNSPMPPELPPPGMWLVFGSPWLLLPKNHPANMIIRHLSDGQIQLRPSDIKEISRYCCLFLLSRCWFSFHAPIPSFTDPTSPSADAEPKRRWSATFLHLTTQLKWLLLSLHIPVRSISIELVFYKKTKENTRISADVYSKFKMTDLRGEGI